MSRYEASPEAKQARDGYAEPMICRICCDWTTRGDLMRFGERCLHCYTRWCRAAFSDHYVAPANAKRPTASDMRDNLRSWPQRTGHPLNSAQAFQLAALERMLAPPAPMVPE